MERGFMSKPDSVMHTISLGAGVQSTTMALMAAHGEIAPMPDCAIFADTGAEPDHVYAHLKWLMGGNVLPFPVHVVSAGNIADDLKKGFTSTGSQGRFVGPPFFIKRMKSNGASYELSMGRRQCTRHYKVDVLRKEQRRLLGYAPGARIPPGSITIWIGISMDEAVRMKPACDVWQVNRWPLIELRMTRKDCLGWLAARGYPKPGKSACTFCPFRDDAGWRDMKANDAKGFEQACEVDDLVRNNGHMRKRRNELFVHRSLTPLREVDLSDPAKDQGDLFLNECEGMCGV
jgi:hypothetical protein